MNQEESNSESVLFHEVEIIVEKKKCLVMIDGKETVDLEIGLVKVINVGTRSLEGSAIKKIRKLSLRKIEK